MRNVETFHGLAVRMIQLRYNGASDANRSCLCEHDPGLSPRRDFLQFYYAVHTAPAGYAHRPADAVVPAGMTTG